jgi:hypothetical protein
VASSSATGLPAAPWPPPAASRLPSSVVSTTTFRRESTASGLTSSLVLASASGRIPCLERMRTVGCISRTVAVARMWRGSSDGAAPVRGAPGVRPLAASVVRTRCSCRGSVLRRIAAFPFLADGGGAGGRHLLDQIQGHFRIDMRLGMDRIRPPGSQSLTP